MSQQQQQQQQQPPERSRNAKAQARHRAKRKAYIDTLEQTVTKLCEATGYTPEQLSNIPPPLARIRELELENVRLLKENEQFRRLLNERGIRIPVIIDSSAPMPPSQPVPGPSHLVGEQREQARHGRRRSDPYTLPQHTNSSTSSPNFRHDVLLRPTPIMIPEHTSYSSSNEYSASPRSGTTPGSTSFGIQRGSPTWHLPETPSTSSAINLPSPQAPVSPMVSGQPHNTNTSGMYRYPPLSGPPVQHHHGHYDPVKSEENLAYPGGSSSQQQQQQQNQQQHQHQHDLHTQHSPPFLMSSSPLPSSSMNYRSNAGQQHPGMRSFSQWQGSGGSGYADRR